MSSSEIRTLQPRNRYIRWPLLQLRYSTSSLTPAEGKHQRVIIRLGLRKMRLPGLINPYEKIRGRRECLTLEQGFVKMSIPQRLSTQAGRFRKAIRMAHEAEGFG